MALASLIFSGKTNVKNAMRRSPIPSNRRTWRLLIVTVALCIVGCVSAPVQEMSNARQAIAAAVQAGASERAPIALNEAQRLLVQAEKRLQDKQFREARRSAVAAKLKAIAALDATSDSEVPD